MSTVSPFHDANDTITLLFSVMMGSYAFSCTDVNATTNASIENNLVIVLKIGVW
jgi:hypothetical protein